MSTMTLSLRLPKNLVNKLNSAASVLERSKTYIMQKALESYLAEQHDYHIALGRLLDKDDPIISSSELRKRLAKDR